MLITTQKPNHTVTNTAIKKAPNTAVKSSQGVRTTEDLYRGGEWDLNLEGSEKYCDMELYCQSRRSAVSTMKDFEEGEATFTSYVKGGDLKTLSPAQRQERLKEAKDRGLKSGLEIAGMTGFLGVMGAAVMSVLGEVGSLFSTMAGGSGVASGFIGLGAIAAIAGGAGLAVGLLTYASERNQTLVNVRQQGRIRKVDQGFEFYPKEGSQDMTPVLVTKKGVTPLDKSGATPKE